MDKIVRNQEHVYRYVHMDPIVRISRIDCALSEILV